jgi:hypothetical protein
VTFSKDEIVFLLRISGQMEVVRCTKSEVLNSFWSFQYIYFIKIRGAICNFCFISLN